MFGTKLKLNFMKDTSKILHHTGHIKHLSQVYYLENDIIA